jgi:regulator of replication initiation timing
MADPEPDIVVPSDDMLQKLESRLYEWSKDLNQIRTDLSNLKITTGFIFEGENLRARFDTVKASAEKETGNAVIGFDKMGEGIGNVRLIYQDVNSKNGDDVDAIRVMVDGINTVYNNQNLPKTVPPPEPPAPEAPPKDSPPNDPPPKDPPPD